MNLILYFGDFKPLLGCCFYDPFDEEKKLMEIKQWGDFKFGDNAYHFFGCTNLNITAVDTPDLSETTSLRGAFAYGLSLDGVNRALNDWDTRTVTDMSLMFYSADRFNQDIGEWNTSGVTSMAYMFSGATTFNQDISRWNTSNVTDMRQMFALAVMFNQDISNWDTSSVTNMSGMFSGSPSFYVRIVCGYEF